MVEREWDQHETDEINGGPEGIPSTIFDNPGAYEEQLPFIKRTVGLVKQFAHTRPQKREAFLDQVAAPIVKDPQMLGHLIENLDLISQIRSEINTTEIKSQLFTRIEAIVARRSGLQNWTPRRIGELVGIGLDTTGESKEAVERMKAALFNAPKGVEEAVDLFYNAAFAMAETTEPDIREELFSILCLEKSWLAANAESVMYFGLGMLSADDEHLSRYFAQLDAVESVGNLVEMTQSSNPTVKTVDSSTPKRVISAHERMSRYEDSCSPETHPTKKAAIDKLFYKDPHRFETLTSVLMDPNHSNRRDQIWKEAGVDITDLPTWAIAYRGFQKMRASSWPDNVIDNPDDPLRRLIWTSVNPLIFRAFWEQQKRGYLEQGYQQVTPQSFQVGERLMMDVIAKDCETPEQKAEVVRQINRLISEHKDSPQQGYITPWHDLVPSEQEEAIQFYPGSSHALDDENRVIIALTVASPDEASGRLASIVKFYKPLISSEQLRVMNEQIGLIRNDLHLRFRKFVSGRGYELIIADPALRQRGYEAITFTQDKLRKGIKVGMMIDNDLYEFRMDKDYRIEPGGDIVRFETPQDQAWLELLTLSHFRKVICTGEDEEELKRELLSGEKQYGLYRRQQVHRIEHLRRQSPGRNFTTEAFDKCLNSNLPMRNLYEINRLRAVINLGGTIETGIWTYVKGVEKDIDTQIAKPIKVAFKGASDDIRKAISLGEISKEEMNRLEKEILIELGVQEL